MNQEVINTDNRSPKESSDGDREKIKSAVEREISERVHDRFGDHPDRGPERSRFFFHRPEHPAAVRERAWRIMKLAREHGMDDADDEAVLAADTAAQAHDLVIRFHEINDSVSPRHGEIDRYRGWGGRAPEAIRTVLNERSIKGNEEASWDELEKMLDDHDPEKKVYTDRVRNLAKKAIAATYPEVPFPFPAFPEGATVIEGRDLAPYLFRTNDGLLAGLKFDQPELTDESPLAVFAVAMGDLAYGGVVDAESFKEHGDEEWAETHPRMIREIEADIAEKNDEASIKEKARIAASIIGWQSAQPGFLLWQKIRFYEHLPGSSNFKTAMSAEYRHFDENILAAADRVEAFKKFIPLKDAVFYTSPEGAYEADQLFRNMVREMHCSV
ncbi:MAG: hypothetical protein Q8Q94_01260 [bacterium]|nr:hypothetical protein [bacterium]MDZ4299378.1 hypothetical protein [Candidatus Sungbacteria bacterium]